MVEKRFLAICIHLVITSCLVTIFYTQFSYFETLYSRIAHILLYAFIAYFTFSLSKKYVCSEKISPNNKAVLITGCDTGFGHYLARRLHSRGFKVFAGCLYPDGKGAKDLKTKCSDNFQVVYIDVRDDESVENSVKFVKENLGDSVFWALVNNAGILKAFSTELTSLDTFKDLLDVNSLGVVRMTKAFLPLIRRSKGRVINITSHDGRSIHKGLCAYDMSKFAAVAFTECLRVEMKVWGVSVISIEPEFFRTCLFETERNSAEIDTEVTKISQEVLASYGEDFVEQLKKCSVILSKWSSPQIDIVISDIESAITDRYPNIVYRPRRNFIVSMILHLEEKLPSTLVDFVVSSIYEFVGFPVPRGAKKVNCYKK